MIRQNTITAVYPLAEKLAGQKLCVKAMAGTPLADIVQSGSLPVPKNAEQDYPLEQRIMDGSMALDASGHVEHDMVMEEVAKTAAKTVTNNLNMARTIVNPMVNEVVEHTQEYINASVSALQTMVSVVPFFYPAIWDTPQIAEMVERYSETANREVTVSFSVPAPESEEALRDLAKTGSPSFDQDVDAFFDSLPEGRAWEVYDKVFSRVGDYITRLNEYVYPVDAMRQPEMVSRVLLVHLWSRRLIDNIPDGVTVDLDTYRTFMINVMAQTGRVINELMERRDRNTRRRSLMTTFPPLVGDTVRQPVNITVNGDVYQQWLQDGGEPEAILGSYVSDQVTDYQTLIDNKEQYVKAWERKVSVLTTAQRFEKFNYAIDGIRAAVKDCLNDMADDELPVDRTMIFKRLEEQLKTLSGSFYEDLHWWVRRVVCNTMYAHTMALTILEAIDAVGDENPDIEPRDAAYLAQIEIVSDWVAAMCTVERTA